MGRILEAQELVPKVPHHKIHFFVITVLIDKHAVAKQHLWSKVPVGSTWPSYSIRPRRPGLLTDAYIPNPSFAINWDSYHNRRA